MLHIDTVAHIWYTMSMNDYTPTLERFEAFMRRVGAHMSIPPVVRVDDAVHVGPCCITVADREHTDGGQPYSETYIVVTRTVATQYLEATTRTITSELGAFTFEYEAVKCVATHLLDAILPRWVYGGNVADFLEHLSHQDTDG